MVTQMKNIDLNNFPVHTSQDFRFGLITREIYRHSENKFEIYDTSDGWVSCMVTLKELSQLINGEIDILNLNWE